MKKTTSLLIFLSLFFLAVNPVQADGPQWAGPYGATTTSWPSVSTPTPTPAFYKGAACGDGQMVAVMFKIESSGGGTVKYNATKGNAGILAAWQSLAYSGGNEVLLIKDASYTGSLPSGPITPTSIVNFSVSGGSGVGWDIFWFTAGSSNPVVSVHPAPIFVLCNGGTPATPEKAANFWNYILSGVQGIIQGTLVWLFGGPENYHHAMGMKSLLGTGTATFFDVFFSLLGVFDLTLPALALIFWFPIWMTKKAIQVWLLIRKIFLIS